MNTPNNFADTTNESAEQQEGNRDIDNNSDSNSDSYHDRESKITHTKYHGESIRRPPFINRRSRGVWLNDTLILLH